jgi:hypothetical protein
MLKNIFILTSIVLIVPLFAYADNDLVWYDDPFSGLMYEEHSSVSAPAPAHASEPKPAPIITPNPKPIVEQMAHLDTTIHQYATLAQAQSVYADAAYQGLAKEANILLGIPEHQHIGLKKIIKEFINKEFATLIIICEKGVFINQDYYDTLPYAVRRLHVFAALNDYYYKFGNRSFLQKIGIVAHYVPAANIIHYESIKKAGCYQCLKEAFMFEGQNAAHENVAYDEMALSLQEVAKLYAVLTESNSLCMYHACAVK